MTVALLAAFAGMVIHEAAHAWTAYLEGDPTARVYGRCTVNPLAHLDPLGSLAMPALALYVFGFPVGWLRPVPVDGALLRHRWSRVRVLLAGPASNLVLAGLCWVVGFHGGAAANLSLAIFNLMPLGSLDGGLVVKELRRERHDDRRREPVRTCRSSRP